VRNILLEQQVAQLATAIREAVRHHRETNPIRGVARLVSGGAATPVDVAGGLREEMSITAGLLLGLPATWALTRVIESHSMAFGRTTPPACWRQPRL
jgi:hypothetical protein